MNMTGNLDMSHFINEIGADNGFGERRFTFMPTPQNQDKGASEDRMQIINWHLQ